MRKILIIALASTVACQDTEEVISQDDQTQAEGTVAEGSQETADEAKDWSVRDDFAGGLDQAANDLIFFEEIADQTDDSEEGSEEAPTGGWGSAPMVEGSYEGTVELVLSNTCDGLVEGDTFDTRFKVDEDGQTLLGGGLLESNGDQLRLNRLKERSVDGAVDCIQVETIDAMGTMFSSEEMELEIRSTVTMMGSDCPVVDPCTDEYLAYLGLDSDNI